MAAKEVKFSDDARSSMAKRRKRSGECGKANARP